jgi:hypothetical protein
MGVSLLPRLAATVSRTTSGINRSFLPEIARMITENGTKVINATSFVIIIDEKKHSRLSIRHRLREFVANARSFEASILNIPSLLKPAITAMRQKRRERVRKSM